MKSSAALEILLSLTLQASLLIVACRWLLYRERDGRAGERGWYVCHLLILLLTCLAWTIPHLRLLRMSALVHPEYVEPWVDYKSEVAYALLVVWLGGATFQLVMLAIGVFQSARLVRAAQSADTLTAGALLNNEHALSSRRLRNLEFRISSQTGTPFCWHISRPIIVLPDKFLTASDAEIQAIVRHELAHLEAGHPLQLFLQRLVEAVYWYLPLVWWASHQARRHREFVCDDEAIRSMREASSYLKGLLLVSQSGSPPVELSAGLAFRGATSLLQERAARIAGRTWRRNGGPAGTFVRRKLTAVAVLISLAWLPVNAAASGRSMWSPWPGWTAKVLYEFGIVARDYEIDGHRLPQHRHVPAASSGNSRP